MGVSGRLYLEVENLYSEGRGFLPWVGGHVASLGLDFYIAPWLGFFIEGGYTSFESNMLVSGINPEYKDYYDQVRAGYNNASVKAGIRLTWAKERY